MQSNFESSFDFLKEKYPDLAANGNEAEKCLRSQAPKSAIRAAGIIGEAVVKEVYVAKRIGSKSKSEKNLNAEQRLEDIRRHIPEEQYRLLNLLKGYRNKASHDPAFGNLNNAKLAVTTAYLVCEWFMQTYIDANYQHRDFVLPSEEIARHETPELSYITRHNLSDNTTPEHAHLATIHSYTGATQSSGFNAARYALESSDPDYISGVKATYSADTDTGIKLLEKCFKKGNILAGIVLGEIYGNTSYWLPDRQAQKHMQNQAITYYYSGQTAGYPTGAILLADAHDLGKGVKKNKDVARALWNQCRDALKEMADTDDIIAQFYYADFLRRYERDLGLAAAAYKQIIAYDDAPIYAVRAGYRLARIYLYGPTQDVSHGVSVLQNIIDRYPNVLDVSVYYELGRACFEGILGASDYVRAATYLSVAADMGDAHSAYYMGEIYYYGLGTKRNERYATSYYQLAACQNYTAAKDRLKDIKMHK